MIIFPVPISVRIPEAETGTVVDDSNVESRLGGGVHADSGAETVTGTI